MRAVLAVAAVLFVGSTLPAQEKKDIERVGPRYNILFSNDLFPQGEPKEALESVIKAIERGRYDYLAAHLLDPEFVDSRLKDSRSTFEEFLEAIKVKMKDDPNLLKQLKAIQKENDFQEVSATTAVASAKEIKDRKVYLKKIGSRWYMLNDRTEPTPKKQ